MIITEFLVPIVYDSFLSDRCSDHNQELLEKHEFVPFTKNRQLINAAPCFITHAEAFQSLHIPDDWTGCIYGSEAILGKMKTYLNNHAKLKSCSLKPNKPTSVNLPDGRSVEVTIFSLSFFPNKEVSMFLIKDGFINCLITSCLGNFQDEVICNQVLRDALRNGIDVLYIDDTILHHEKPDDSMHPNKFQLDLLLKLVRPNEVIGMLGKTLPKYIALLCHNEDPFLDLSTLTRTG